MSFFVCSETIFCKPPLKTHKSWETLKTTYIFIYLLRKVTIGLCAVHMPTYLYRTVVSCKLWDVHLSLILDTGQGL